MRFMSASVRGRLSGSLRAAACFSACVIASRRLQSCFAALLLTVLFMVLAPFVLIRIIRIKFKSSRDAANYISFGYGGAFFPLGLLGRIALALRMMPAPIRGRHLFIDRHRQAARCRKPATVRPPKPAPTSAICVSRFILFAAGKARHRVQFLYGHIRSSPSRARSWTKVCRRQSGPLTGRAWGKGIRRCE